MKRKPKVVEAKVGWCAQCGPLSAAALDEDGCCAVCGADATGPGADKALRLLKRADPHAKIKADVVRAARAMLVALAAPGRDPHGHAELDLLAALGNLDEAVSKLQKVKP